MTFEDHVFKVGDLVRFARRADKYTGPDHWTGNDANGELVNIHELTPDIVTDVHDDE